MTLFTSHYASAVVGGGGGGERYADGRFVGGLPIRNPIGTPVAPTAVSPTATTASTGITANYGIQARPVAAVQTATAQIATAQVATQTVAATTTSAAPASPTSLSQNTWIAYLFPQDTTMAANLKTAAANGNVNTEIATANAQLQALAPYAPMPISVMGSSFTIPRTITPASIAAAQANSSLIPAATYASMVAANNYSGILSAEVAAARTMVTNATALIPAQTILTATQTYGPQLAAYLNQSNYTQAFAFAAAHGLMKYMETSYGLELLGIPAFSQAQMTAFFTAAGPYWNINILGTNPYSNTLWGDPGKLAGDATTNFQTSGDNSYPDLARFAGKRPSGGSIFGKILLAVAAVVATVFTAGAAAAVLGPALGAALGTSAAIGGAIAGAAASTVLNTAIDVAEGQSLGSAFTGSLVSAAVGGVLGGTDLGSLTSSSVANGAIDGAVGGAATGLVQGGNIGKDVLGGALGGGIAAGIDPAIDTLDNGNQYATKAIGGALAYGAAAAATGQNIVIAAANGAGSGIGQAAGATFANQYNAPTATDLNPAWMTIAGASTTSAIAGAGLQTSGFSLDGTSAAQTQDSELDPVVTTAQRLPASAGGVGGVTSSLTTYNAPGAQYDAYNSGDTSSGSGTASGGTLGSSVSSLINATTAGILGGDSSLVTGNYALNPGIGTGPAYVEDSNLGETMVRPPGWNSTTPIPEVSNGDMTLDRPPGYGDGVPPNWWMENNASQQARLEAMYNIQPMTWCETGQMCGSIATQVDDIMKGGDGVLDPVNGAYYKETFADMGTPMTEGLNPTQLFEALQAAPDGSTFLVGMYPKDGSAGHVINAQNFVLDTSTDGQQLVTMFVDGQLGGQEASTTFERLVGKTYGTTDLDSFSFGIADTSNARIDNPNLLGIEKLNYYVDSTTPFNPEGLLAPLGDAASSVGGRLASIGAGASDLLGGPVGMLLMANGVVDNTETALSALSAKNVQGDLSTITGSGTSLIDRLVASGDLYIDGQMNLVSSGLHEVNALPGQILQGVANITDGTVTMPATVATEQQIIAQEYGGQTTGTVDTVMANHNGYVVGPDGTWLDPQTAAQMYPAHQVLDTITVTAQAPSYGTVISQTLQDTGTSIGNWFTNTKNSVVNYFSPKQGQGYRDPAGGRYRY